MNFPYLHTETYMEDLEIEDTGNCYLNALNDGGEEWYLCIDTELGWTTIQQFGPLIADMDNLPGFFSYSRTKIEYDEKKLYKTINEFLNSPKKLITQAVELDRSEIEKRFAELHIHI